MKWAVCSVALLCIWIGDVLGSCEHMNLPGCDCEYPKTNRFELFCEKRGFTAIPENVDYRLQKGVTVGNFSFNRISSIPDLYFSKMKYFDILDFTSNSIQMLSNTTFQGLESQLTTLNMSQNAIGSLPPNTFSKLIRLDTLDLSSNSIKNPCNIHTKDVVTYSLAKNGITSLRDHCFAEAGGDIKVETLDLSGNVITMIDSDAFDGLINLKNLILDNNLLKSVGDGLKPLTSVSSFKSLSLRHNGMETLHSICVYVWPNIQKIDISGNKLTSIQPNCFKNYGSGSPDEVVVPLLTLNFAYNNIRRVESYAFSGLANRLNTLYLNGNKIGLIDNMALQNLVKLETLDLSDNKLDDLMFLYHWDRNALVHLFIANNEIRTLPPNIFDKMTNLETLVLSGNLLLSIESAAFTGMTSLTSLSLSKNLITNLADGAFRGVEQLKRLHLSSNALVTLKNCSFAGLVDLLEFHFDDNLLHCDCDVQWLVKYKALVQERGELDVNTHDPVKEDFCHTPTTTYENTIANFASLACKDAPIAKSCFGGAVKLSEVAEGTVNVSWSWSSQATLKMVQLTQLDVESNEIVYSDYTERGQDVVSLPGFAGERIMKICVDITLVNNEQQKDCVVWPPMIKKPTEAPPTVLMTTTEAGMPSGTKAAIALAIILIIIIILLVLCAVYLWKTKKYRGLLPDRFASKSNGASAAPKANGANDTNGKRPIPFELQAGEEDEGSLMIKTT